MPKHGNSTVPIEWLDLAQNQAACIHPREEIADKVVKEAARLLSVRSTQQKKRLFARTNHPTRIYLEDLHLFQHLVFLRSERYERDQELFASSSITETDLIVRYIAFIVRKSLRRNSLYGLTGICRFICRYSLSEVREIHGAMMDPDLFKTDDDFRSYRKKLRDMIFKRFSEYLHFENEHCGKEKHFYLRENQDELSLRRLVTWSLNSFQPWKTRCLPRDFKVDEEEQTTFKHPDEHICEIKRLHALIHQDCFRILTGALGCDEPSSRLGIPRFFSVNSSNGPIVDPFNSDNGGPCGHEPNGVPRANYEKLKELQRALFVESKRLTGYIPKGSLSVRLDGREITNFKVDEGRQVQFTVADEAAELIEIVDETEQLVIAAHLLDDGIWESPKRQCSYVVRHDHGPKIVFSLNRLETAGTIDKQLLVVVTYKNTPLAQVWFFLKQRIARSRSVLVPNLAGWAMDLLPSNLRTPAVSTSFTPVLVFASLVIVVGLVLAMLWLPPSTQHPVGSATTNEPATSPSPVYRKTDDPVHLNTRPEMSPTQPHKSFRRSRYQKKSERVANNEVTANSMPKLALTVQDQINDPLSARSLLQCLTGEVRPNYEGYSCLR